MTNDALPFEKVSVEEATRNKFHKNRNSSEDVKDPIGPHMKAHNDGLMPPKKLTETT